MAKRIPCNHHISVDALRFGERHPHPRASQTRGKVFRRSRFGNQFIDVIPSLDLIVVRFGTDPMAQFNVATLAADARFTKHDDILKPILLGVH